MSAIAQRVDVIKKKCVQCEYTKDSGAFPLKPKSIELMDICRQCTSENETRKKRLLDQLGPGKIITHVEACKLMKVKPEVLEEKRRKGEVKGVNVARPGSPRVFWRYNERDIKRLMRVPKYPRPRQVEDSASAPTQPTVKRPTAPARGFDGELLRLAFAVGEVSGYAALSTKAGIKEISERLTEAFNADLNKRAGGA